MTKDSADRWRSAHSRKRMNDTRRAILLDPDEQRRSRAEVYRTDVPFADNEDPVNPLPPAGTAARGELVRRVTEMKHNGMTQSAIAADLGYDWQQINSLCTLHKIKKRKPDNDQP